MELIGLIPSFGNLAWTVAAFIVALSIIVAVHEYGHYIVGRWSGIHAEVFSLGFGPVLYSRIDKRGTRWQFAALPLGGFVKFLGDADAASGKDGAQISTLTEAERRHTMHGAPLWARSATVAAGPMFNFAFSILIFSGFFLFNGIATELPVVGKMKATPFAGQSLLPGDRIVALSGTETPDLAAFLLATDGVPPAPVVEYLVQRAGQKLAVPGPYPFPPIADAVQPKSAAQTAGIEAGDVILSVNGTAMTAFSELRKFVGASDGQPLNLQVWRDGTTFETTMEPRRMDIPLSDGGFETRWLIGVSGGLVFVPQTRTPGPLEALTLSTGETWRIVRTNLSFLWHIVQGQVSSCNLSGPITIAQVSGATATQGPESFILFIAMLSTAVGLMNLFPIPVLDGGHLVFHAWEAVRGKPPTDWALRLMMTAGLAVLVVLMVFALSNDLFCP